MVQEWLRMHAKDEYYPFLRLNENAIQKCRVIQSWRRYFVQHYVVPYVHQIFEDKVELDPELKYVLR